MTLWFECRRSRRFGLVAGVVLATLVFGRPAGAAPSLVVIDVQAPRDGGAIYLERGDILPADRALNLPAGAVLTLIDPSGQKIEIRGPFQGKVEISAPPAGASGAGLDVVAVMAKIFQRGATRSLGLAAITDPWTIDVRKTEHGCYRTGPDVRLWREITSRADTLFLDTGAGAALEVEWPVRKAEIAWPENAELGDGLTYTTWLRSRRGKHRLTLHRVPDDLPTRMHQAAWMAERKCEGQARLLALTADVDRLIDAMIEKKKF